ncbi:DUF1403 family protein [Limimaricola hongkongensis]|uniref:DUF1403 family protein n=1 Tax=Limimaricola hongkongensis DSM 17492 TaxID=1122180 RepID=A0A017H8U8_9RHOB|nr:DUF1403 family protein [Limimaricola hongkongensis]EYD70533.1 hypothetical protein Lokhon_02167 [Limimaricola hongkongensis DSM 17492]
MPAPLPSDLSAFDWPAAPGWAGGGAGKGGGDDATAEEAAFRAGAALAHLHMVMARPDLPLALWRDRLALGAATANAGISGRREGLPDLRDALHLARPGDRPGPAGEIYRAWRRAVTRPLTLRALAPGLPGLPGAASDVVAPGLMRSGPPVARAAGMLETVLTEAPRAETAALILADAALARALGWDRIVPLLATELAPRDLRRDGEELRHACHRAVALAAARAAGLAQELTRGAARLRAVAPKLRARRAGEAVALFLTHDALAPAALRPMMSDRAARRLCDRLVSLGALRELTGRDSFRLYGL